MKKRAIALAPLLVVGLLVLAACGTSSSTGGSSGTTSTSSSNTVTLGQTNFDQSSITIQAGTALTFDDTNGAFHQICLGHDQQCNSTATGPKDLQNGGFSISIGQKHSVTFDTPGTYQITCSIHPNMNLTVIVQ
ncbi:MAG: plastocyanin/azurin family copper-binding protein [Ktedonobacterales bacterium]